MAFKIFRKNCCGPDVHKTWIYACVGITDPTGRTEYKQARFSSFTKGLQELADWLAKYDCNDVCMESSGKFWIPVFNILEKTCWVSLAHPKYTKPQKGNKTDRKDAKWICDLYMCDMVKPSFIPPPDIRQLRDLMRYRMKLTVEEVQAAVDGAISHEQAVKLRECLQHLDELETHKTNIEKEILRLAQQYPYQLELLQTVPGFSGNIMTAIALISEIGADMSVFPSAKHLVSWAGCCPRNDQSSKKVKSTRISRAGVYLKPLLVQVANAVIKSDKYPECKERYRRIKARRGHKKAIIAVCRMLLTAIWNILSKLEPYSAAGYLEDKLTEHSVVISKAQGLELLRKRG